MNRQIEFRGKRKDNKEWVYGNFVEKVNYIGGGTQTCIQTFTHRADGTDMWMEVFESELIEVEPNTVGQFIGLVGEHNRKIYEGDIIRIRETQHEDWFVGEVKYFSEGDYPAFDLKPSIECDSNGLSYAMACCEVEIIGNITDNPELLKGE